MKRTIYLGVGLILVSIFIAFSISSGVSNISKNYIGLMTIKNATIAKNSFYTIGLTQSDIRSGFYAITSNSINFYLMNSKAYKVWNNSKYIKEYKSGIIRAEHLEGKGVIVIYNNTSIASFPVVSSDKVLYSIKGSNKINSNNSTNMTYYLVADNTNGSRSEFTTVRYTLFYLPNLNSGNTAINQKYNRFKNNLRMIRIKALISGILFIAGIIVILYGFITKRRDKKKEDATKEDKNEEYINDLYKNIDTSIKKDKKPKQKKNKSSKKAKSTKKG